MKLFDTVGSSVRAGVELGQGCSPAGDMPASTFHYSD